MVIQHDVANHRVAAKRKRVLPRAYPRDRKDRTLHLNLDVKSRDLTQCKTRSVALFLRLA